MTDDHFFTTRICALLGVDVPIANAGMGPFARAPLAAAVSNAGGLGTMGVPHVTIAQLRAMIEEARSLTDGPLAVNHVPHFHPGMEYIEAAVAAGIDAIVTGWVDPAPIVAVAHAGGTKVIHRCLNAREAAHAAERGVDVIYAQGSDAGGHTGEIPGMGLLPAVVDAAGGVGDGRGLVAALALGADGAILGTRFIASQEAYAHDIYKRTLVETSEADSVENVLFGQREWPGEPARMVRNSTVREYEAESEPRVPVVERPLEIIARRHLSEGVEEIPRYFVDAPWPEDEGDIEAMVMYAGTSVGVVRDILPAGEIVARVMREAADAWQRLATMRTPVAGMP